MPALIDLIMHEYPAHTFEAVVTAPVARWFALVPALEERHGVASGSSFVARSMARAVRETEDYLAEHYRIE